MCIYIYTVYISIDQYKHSIYIYTYVLIAIFLVHVSFARFISRQESGHLAHADHRYGRVPACGPPNLQRRELWENKTIQAGAPPVMGFS